ncbi:MAG: elongation factor 1-beta [Candidatus Pacearchaeota archaeon]|nr:MAG: elongation factor 1-beta [Candidatus Pacearchaeota archaeon]
MAMAILKLKIMPKSPDTDLGKIKIEIEERAKRFDAKVHSSEEQPIAFGLKALIVTLAWPEEKSTEGGVEEFLHIEEISSIDVIDYRRAFG